METAVFLLLFTILVESLLFLIPGIGQQGGAYNQAIKHGKNNDGVALVSASRSIMFGGK